MWWFCFQIELVLYEHTMGPDWLVQVARVDKPVLHVEVCDMMLSDDEHWQCLIVYTCIVHRSTSCLKSIGSVREWWHLKNDACGERVPLICISKPCNRISGSSVAENIVSNPLAITLPSPGIPTYNTDKSRYFSSLLKETRRDAAPCYDVQRTTSLFFSHANRFYRNFKNTYITGRQWLSLSWCLI